MIKRYVYVGLVLLVIAGLLFYSIRGALNSSPPKVASLTVPAGRMGDVQVPINATAITVVLADLLTNGTNTNIYFLNQSAFGGLSGYLDANQSASAYSYVKAHGINASDIFANKNGAIKYVYPNASTTSPDYYLYVVIDSTSGSQSSNSVLDVSVVYNSYSYSSLSGAGKIEIDLMILAFVFGLGFLAYGAIRKPKAVAVGDIRAAKTKEAKGGKRRYP